MFKDCIHAHKIACVVLMIGAVSTAFAATGSDDTDLSVIGAANENAKIALVRLTNTEPTCGVSLLVQGYSNGAVTNLGISHAKVGWTPPMEGAKVTFCVSLREGQLPLLDRTNVVHGNHRFIPKTGSMRLGFAFGYSGNTQGESVEIDNASLNLFSANIVECDKQPFRIRVKEEKDARLIPVVAIFPANFHANILKGNIYATNLPNSTVVVYARFDVPAKQERETGR